MKIIYKCQYTGKEFSVQEDCEVWEYEHGGEQQKFYDLVNEFIGKLEDKYSNITVNKSTLRVEDYKEFLYRDRLECRRSVRFDFKIDGEQKEYRRYSDEVGDWSWNWKIKDDVDDFILDFEKEFIYPELEVLEGNFISEWNHNEGLTAKFGDLDSNYLINLLHNKKIRIKILERYDGEEED